jgi:outer membrane protein, multidrug efflux system
MKKGKMNRCIILIFFSTVVAGCITPRVALKKENNSVPSGYSTSTDSTNVARVNWRQYFGDENLIALIDSALRKNQELNITIQEVQITQNEIRARKGEYLPFVGFTASAGVEKAGRFTRYGAVDENIEIKPGTAFPEPFNDYRLGLSASWEVDIWKKLRNAKKAAVLRYLASAEGRNFMVTNLIAEIANSYYELLALDNLLKIIEQNIEIQTNGFEVVKQQMSAAKVTQLAVSRFQAQLLHTKNLQYEIRQRIVETENRIRFLTGGSVMPKCLTISSLTPPTRESLRSCFQTVPIYGRLN